MSEATLQDRQRVSMAIHAAEAQTEGEIVCVLAQSSADATPLAVLVAALLALALPWLLVLATQLAVVQILGLQLALFLALVMLVCLPRVRMALLPRAAQRAMADRAAMEQFVLRGVGRTRGRTGVLIFVSLAERYARIVADEAIARQVAQSEWQDAVEALVAATRDGRIADGFVEAIARCAAILARHFPATAAQRNELPDRLYLV